MYRTSSLNVVMDPLFPVKVIQYGDYQQGSIPLTRIYFASLASAYASYMHLTILTSSNYVHIMIVHFKTLATPYYNFTYYRKTRIEDRVTNLERGQKHLEDRLGDIEQSISVQIAQSQESILFELTTLLGKNHGEKK